MPSTYSPSLRLELIGNGEQAGTWGTTTNNNLGTLLEQAITGVQPITLTGGDYTLTDFNGLPDQSRNAVLVFGGLLAAPCNVIAPSSEKIYIVRNFSNATVTIKTSSGNGVAIANAASEVIFCDGSDFYSATQFNYIDGDLTVSGTATANNLVATNNITLGKDFFGNASTGQVYLPTGNTSTRTGSPIVGLIRYNTTGQFYEGYTNATWVRFIVAPQGNYTVTYAVAAGGAGGGTNVGGGGGAGGLLQGTITAIPSTVYTITVGAGGATGSGGTSSIILGTATAVTGGAGGGTVRDGGSGASGGGAGGSSPGDSTVGGTGIPGQGNNGGSSSGGAPSGGGGGAGAAGASGGSTGGAGGAGVELTITGTPTYICGGGGGSGAAAGPSAGGAGGAGGGGAGGENYVAGVAGTVNTGGGGGGGIMPGGAGGSGCVYLSMPTVNYSGTTTGLPTVTTFGSTTVLRYTISGTYTA